MEQGKGYREITVNGPSKSHFNLIVSQTIKIIGSIFTKKPVSAPRLK